MKKLNFLRKTFSVLAMLLMGSLFAQDLDAFNDVLSEGATSAQQVAGTVKTIAMILMGLAAIAYIGVAMLGGRDGDDKIKKFGNWVMVIGFIALGIFIVAQIFGV